jgi:hypothetical protein
MATECTPTLFAFEAVERKAVVASFDGGMITSNGGALLLGQVDRGLGLSGTSSPTVRSPDFAGVGPSNPAMRRSFARISSEGRECLYES